MDNRVQRDTLLSLVPHPSPDFGEGWEQDVPPLMKEPVTPNVHLPSTPPAAPPPQFAQKRRDLGTPAPCRAKLFRPVPGLVLYLVTRQSLNRSCFRESVAWPRYQRRHSACTSTVRSRTGSVRQWTSGSARPYSAMPQPTELQAFIPTGVRASHLHQKHLCFPLR